MFVAGEAAGIGGADLALVEGELAGHVAAAHAVASGNGASAAPWDDLAALRRRRAKLAGFADVLADLFDPRPGLRGLAHADTVLCRCEDVTAGAVDAAVAGGATTMAALKIVTRCGQGPCQGRTCERLVCGAAAGARALQRPGPDPADPARRPDGR